MAQKTIATETENSHKPEHSRTINYILFFTGILLIAGAVLLFCQYNLPGRERLAYSILAIGVAIAVSQVPVFINIKLHNGVTAGGAAAFAAMIYFFNPATASPAGLVLLDSTDAGRNIPDCNNQKINIAIFTGGNVDYTRAIKTFFLNTLQPKMNFFYNKCLYYEDYYVSPEIKNDSDLIDQVARTNILNRDFQYYVAIGTSAAVALRKFFRQKQIVGRKMIFLGVTDPVACGLVNTVTNRKENTNIAGVAYCGDFEDLPARIHRFYPHDTLVYIYNTANLQDEQIAQRLKNTPLAQDKLLEIKRLEGRYPDANDFADGNKVYFSWMTLETFFSTENVSIIRNIPKIVSTTQTHSELGLIPLAVSTSDEEIGKAGADLLLKSLKEPSLNLGNLDVYVPKWKTYVNRNKAIEKGLEWEAIQDADKKF